MRSQAKRWPQWDTIAREVISEGWHRLWCLLLAVFDPARMPVIHTQMGRKRTSQEGKGTDHLI